MMYHSCNERSVLLARNEFENPSTCKVVGKNFGIISGTPYNIAYCNARFTRFLLSPLLIFNWYSVTSANVAISNKTSGSVFEIQVSFIFIARKDVKPVTLGNSSSFGG